jgi:hypothetical protein
MVTKADFESSLADQKAEIRKKIGELKAQIELRFQQVANDVDRRFTLAEEQSRILVQTVILTIRQEIQVLDAKIDKGSTLSPISHIHQSQLHQVSTYRTS